MPFVFCHPTMEQVTAAQGKTFITSHAAVHNGSILICEWQAGGRANNASVK
jgi:hypothetical protein